MKKRFEFRHVNELTGLFVLGCFLVIGLALFITARTQQWFVAKVDYELQLPPEGAFGLRPGNDVFLLGLPAGVVSTVLVGERGNLRVRVRVRRDFAQFVCDDSQALIKKVFGVAGDSYVEISRGTGTPLPEKGAVIPCQSSEELPNMMDRVFEEVRQKVLPVVGKLSAALDEWIRLGTDLNTSQVELHEALARLNKIAAGLEKGEGTAGRILKDPTLIDRSERLLGESGKTLAELQVLVGQLRDGIAVLPEIAENLRQGTARLPAISAAVEGETRDLPGLVFQVQQTASELERLTEAMQRHWLLRSYVEPVTGGGRIPSEQIPGGSP